MHYFKHIQDVVWEDHKPPTSRVGVAQNLNYLRMSYLVKKMMKYSKQPKRRNLQNETLTDETKIAGTTWSKLRSEACQENFEDSAWFKRLSHEEKSLLYAL